MPLLKRKAKLEKSTASEYLRDDDEVFHCEVTDEIFKDYEEYCERIILVNSMVWSCEMTGKNNLTFAEALESEKAARRSLKDFPMELRIPILYLAAKTKRSSFAELSEDVFNYVRERYFVGETVEACLEGENWRESHVLSVTAPKQEPGSKATLPATSYCYEVEQFEESTSSGQIGTASHDRVRRRKGVFSRDKCRLFLKQFVEMENGIVGIKKAALEKYNINKVNFDQIFMGPPPEFPSSKKLIKSSLSPSASKSQPKPGSASKINKSAKKLTPNQKGKQESMDKFVKKTVKSEASPSAKKSAQELAEKMRRAEEEMRRRKEEEKALKKEKNARLQAYMKEWQKVKDDLLLEDHKIIPKGTPLYIEGIDHEHIGNFLSVLEFVHLYGETLNSKDVFHNGLDIETFRKALVSKEHTCYFTDLVQMMMTTIFSLQEDEAEEYNEGGRIAESNGTNDEEVISGEMGSTKAVELATKACKWSQTYLGTPLSKLPLDPTTISEVVRLHVLSSGARAGGRCATWRYQQRGGYSSQDDAGLRLRVSAPAVVRRLATTHLAELRLYDKFTILQCLMNQILSYATVRDIIEEKLENYKTMKQELRMLQIQERKRESELLNAKSKLKKAKAVDPEQEAALEKLTKEADEKKAQYLKKSKQLQGECFEYVSFLGSDRAYRRYWMHQSVAGLLVEAGDEPRGPCEDKPVLPVAVPHGTHATHVTPGTVPPPPRSDDMLAHVTKLFEMKGEKGGSDKENDSGANSRGNSPKKPLTHINGLSHKLNGVEANLQLMKDLLVCTGDINSCYVHGNGDYRPQWWVYHTEEQIDMLIQSLNKRGYRESELRTALEVDRDNIVEYATKAPMSMLNATIAPPSVTSTRLKKFQPSLVVPNESTVTEALELSLRDYILEFEEKIFHGCLGSIKLKDREAWRGTIMLRGYDKQAEYLTWGPNRQYRDDCHFPNGVTKQPSQADIEEKPIPENKYRDPGYYLGEEKGERGGEAGAPQDVVRDLASALLQIEQGIHHKYLKRPLGLDDKERKEREARGKSLDMEALERWEISLMDSRSFAQIFLHLFTLDSSVTWSASILNASCKICRRKTDPDNMLLCDNCNKGHHLYCLKPKLTKVPEGDWFCAQCKPKEELKTPRKKRKLFSDEEADETLEEECGSLEVCGGCGSGGDLAARCWSCGARYHAECGGGGRRWHCPPCLKPHREQRRCAATAMSNIHQYALQLNDTIPETSESEDSDDNTALVKLKTRISKRDSKEPSPLVNGHSSKKSRKSKEETNTRRKSRNSGASTPLMNGHHHEERGKKRGRQEDFHQTELESLLRDVMKHKDSWPFYEPVSLDEVPDYLEVIETPMDLTTIQQKLNDGEYSTDQQLIDDAALIFHNCFTYNHETHLVAKAGVRLEKYFNKRCTELHLPTLPELNLESGEPSSKRPRAN